MFCPVCNAYLQERQLIKTNVKKWENADIEYDARCPFCTEEIGRMSWGKLTVRTDLAKQVPSSVPAAPSAAPASQPAGSHPYCPHCGGALPDDLSKLPRR